MNLYRIDILYPHRKEALTDFAGVRLIRQRSAANEAARNAAQAFGMPASITRIQGAGMLKHMGTFYPNGSFDRHGDH